MGIIRWYKRDPDAALTGMAGLTLEERGAYNTVLDLIYSHQGHLEDNEKFLAGWLRVDVRVWRRIRKRLIDLGKLYLHAGELHNARADHEIHAALLRVASAAQAGLASAAKREDARKIINALPSAAVQRPFQLPTTTSTKKDILSSSESIAARPREPGIGEPQSGQQGKKPSDATRAEIEEAHERRRSKE